MKIRRLYTKEQFISYLKETNDIDHSRKLGLIFRFNDLQKQFFKKEMAVNLIEKPKKYEKYLKCGSFGALTLSELEACQKYNKAKKKKIFKNLRITESGEFVVFKDLAIRIKGLTLHELSEQTGGEIETINLEI